MFSAHSEGRAADIYLRASYLPEKRAGDLLFRAFSRSAARLGVDHVIWNGQIWSASRGGPRHLPKDRNQHRDHVHVAFTRIGSQGNAATLGPFLRSLRPA